MGVRACVALSRTGLVERAAGRRIVVTTRLSAAEEIFLALADLGAGEREALLVDRCANDPALRAEIEAMLRMLDVPDEGFLDPATVPSLDMAAVDGPLQPGTALGDFLVLHAIGSGGMGVVYAAQQDRPRRTVAIKVLRRGFRHAEILRRFEREAELLGRLQHHGIAQVFSFHPGDRRIPAHLVMELISGPPITEYVQAHALPVAARVQLMIAVCDAVQHAHDRGIVHRDLKPANVLVTDDGRPKVLDFGIARATGRGIRSSVQTAHGQMIGTLAYMSPEQLRGASEDVDGRSDVYALGTMLYRVMAGRLPFDVADLPLFEAAQRILQADIRRLGTIDPELAGPIEQVAERAMSKERHQRHQSAADLAADLRACLEGHALSASTGASALASTTVARLLVAESPDRRWIAIGLLAGAVVILDGTTGARVALIPGDGQPLDRVAFDRDGRLAIRRSSGHLDLINIPDIVWQLGRSLLTGRRVLHRRCEQAVDKRPRLS
jgi:eukaryotic-like serine/threonine-protein kinase